MQPPKAIFKVSKIPLHFMKKIMAELDRDVAWGVIELVPENTPVTWRSRMSILPKKDGTLRRVMDLREIN